MTTRSRDAVPSPQRMLVIDDEPDFCAILAEYFTEHGFEVLKATNGLEGLLHVKRTRPGVVVLDLAMPRLGGLEALKRIHAFDPRIVVVVVTAQLDPEIHQQALDGGARAVLTKPLGLADLRALLTGPRPVIVSAGSPAEPRVAPPAVEGIPAQLLVVDDDVDVRGTLAEYFSLRGYAVRTAADGAEAIREIVEAPADVVLLDIDMPGLSGDAALPTVRAVAPHSAVIMVSGTVDEHLAQRLLAQGAFDFVAKPVDLAYLEQSVETALAMRILET